MSRPRRSWPNPLGKGLSLVSLAGAGGMLVVGGVLALLERGWVAVGSLVVVGLPLAAFAFVPAWSVTVGRRGVGVRRLAGHRFVRREALLGVRRAPGGLSALRIETDSGTVSIWPQPRGSLELADFVETMSRTTGPGAAA